LHTVLVEKVPGQNRFVEPEGLRIEGNLMLPERSSDVKFEIGHVLFIDIVGYSKLLINEQSEQIQTLNEIVRTTEQFRRAEAEGELLRLPTSKMYCKKCEREAVIL
jgi:hypothetical protein